MKTKLALSFIILHSSFCLSLHSQGTSFTYQGRLNDGVNPATGIYDLRFALFDLLNAGTQQGNLLTNAATGVTNGLFAVTLDFGNQFPGSDRWLEIGVRTNNGGAFIMLSPREKITPVPYSIYAGSAGNSASYSGPVALSQLPPTVALLNSNQVFIGAVSFNNPSNSFAGNGTGLGNVRFSLLDGTGVESLRFGNLVFQNFLNATSGPVAAGDMNGDGRADFIGYDNSTGSLLVMTNNGKSNFGLLASYGPGVTTGNIIIADVNGDGKLDVVTAVGNSVSVYTNTGSGALALSSSTPTGATPRAIATADFNNDGRPDVVTADAGPNTLTVLTNNGHAGFGFFATLTGVGPFVWDVIAADVNGDDRPDIISSKLSQSLISGNLNVFTNNGGNGFALASTPTTGVNPLGIAAADLNGDGHVDLVSADYGAFGFGKTISVLINDGSGNFFLSSTPSLGTATGPSVIATADVNGDGKIDVFCSTGGTNGQNSFSVSVLTNDGTGLLNLSLVLPGEGSVVPADVNADGFTDLIGSIARTNGNNIISIPDVWLNEPFGITFHPPVTVESTLTVAGAATLNNPANNFSGNGAGLTSLNATAITSGTLADARLSTNVALRAGGNTFNGGQNINGQIRLNSTDGFSQSSIGNFAVDAPFIIGGRVMVLTNGNFGIGTNSPQQKLHVIGNILASGTITGSSDRNVKEHFSSVNPRDVLEKVSAIPITEWNYKADSETLRHIGPMAQDFYSAFNVGLDDKHISMVDADGVALAAIQGLNQKLEQKLEQKEMEITELKQRLDTLEKIIRDQKPN
jgi:hypothetical protein